MPKAAMDENDGATARENEIGSSRQSPVVQPIAISETVRDPPNGKLYTRVLAPNTRHSRASSSWCEYVHVDP